ncbi:MAG: RNA methyltransferase [Pseudobdellovibrionaceae bacterium]
MTPEKRPRVAVGLLHYPIWDREKKIVATNVTNFDIHDIARASTCYGIEKYFIIHPMKEQLMYVDRVLDHWKVGPGSKFNPFRRKALQEVWTAESLDHAKRQWGVDCKVIGTHARPVPGAKTYSFRELRERMPEEPHLILFGTGFGMTDEYMTALDGVLEPIKGNPPQDFRHLSVRSAVSICLDRLLGTW